MTSPARLETYRAKADELEHLARETPDDRLRWQREVLARAYRAAVLAADGRDLPLDLEG